MQSVVGIEEYGLPTVATQNDMIKPTGQVKSRSAWYVSFPFRILPTEVAGEVSMDRGLRKEVKLRGVINYGVTAGTGFSVSCQYSCR